MSKQQVNRPITENQADRRRHRKTKIGRVSKNSMDKTIVITVETKVRHPLYGKIIKKNSSFNVHDEKNEANIGDLVEITETRPLSKSKRWRLNRVVERADEL